MRNEDIRQLRNELKPFRLTATIMRWIANKESLASLGPLPREWIERYDEETEDACETPDDEEA